MSTRSSARNLFPPLDIPELTIRRRSRADPTLLNDFEMAVEGNGDPPVLDLRTMEELCQPSLNGRCGPIAPIAIQAINFGIKNDMIQQVQNSCQFHSLSGDDANKHLDKFLHVTQSIKVNGVTDDSLRLNEITKFRQRPDKSLFEAWERYKLLIDRCPNHNMLPVTQIDTFYNGLTLRYRDTINAAAGGTFMKRRPEECYDLIENMTAHYNDWDTSAQRSESSSSITSSSDSEIVALKAEMAEINKNLMRPPLAKLRTYMLREPTKANNAIIKSMHTNMTSLTNSNLELKNMFGQFMKINIASSSGLETLPGELTLRVGKEAITFNLDQTSRYSGNYNDMTTNRIDVIDMACEEYSQEVIGFSDVITSGNPTPYYDPIVSTSSSTLTPFGDSDFLLEEVDAFLALKDDPTLSEEITIYEAKIDKSSIDEPPEVEPKDLPLHLEYTFLEGDNKLPVIIAKDLSDEEKTALITVLKSRKRAITWKLSNIKGINPEFCTHKILMEDDFEPAVQHQRRVNLEIHDVIKNEVLKLLDARLIYPISDSPWEKSHFMVKEGIVLGYKISKDGIEVDKAKVDVIGNVVPTDKKDVNHYSRTTSFCSKSVRIKSSEGVYTAGKPLTFSRLATMDPPRDIMSRTTLPRSVKERFGNEMKCLKIPSKFMKFLTFRASTSWGRSRLYEGTNIYSDVFISKKYIVEILDRAHMVNCNPGRVPIDTESKLGSDGDPTLFRCLACSLQCLTFTRLDISYAVQHVCLYMHDPREPHFLALKRILRYIRGTLDYGLHLFSSSTTDLVTYSDADWAGCPTTRRST
nr:reverse transcriptase domain-containing protein [Tanacetum cinerariifolium]